jgi:hypothetical protein
MAVLPESSRVGTPLFDARPPEERPGRCGCDTRGGIEMITTDLDTGEEVLLLAADSRQIVYTKNSIGGIST